MLWKELIDYLIVSCIMFGLWWDKDVIIKITRVIVTIDEDELSVSGKVLKSFIMICILHIRND